MGLRPTNADEKIRRLSRADRLIRAHRPVAPPSWGRHSWRRAGFSRLLFREMFLNRAVASKKRGLTTLSHSQYV
jgi:hypothetical protein